MNYGTLKKLFTFTAFFFSSTILAIIIDKSSQADVTVFPSTKGLNGKPDVFYRIPSLVTVNSQKLLIAFSEQRIGNYNQDSGNINVVYRYSKDHGATWSPQRVMCSFKKDGLEGTCGNPTVTVDQGNGSIHVFLNANEGHKKQFEAKKGSDEVYQTHDRMIYYMRGTFVNDRIVWDKTRAGHTRRNLTKMLQKNFLENFDLVGPGRGLIFDNPKSVYNGRIVIPASSRVFYSDNKRAKYLDDVKWVESDIMNSNQSSETTIVQLPNNTIYRNDRMHGRFKQGSYCINQTGVACKRRRIVSIIRHAGHYIQEEAEVDVRLADPPAQGSLLRYTDKNIFFANCRNNTYRRNLVIRMTDGSFNNNTERAKDLKYSGKLVQVDNKCGYSSMTKTRDYRIGILYERPSTNPVLKDLTMPLADGGTKPIVPQDIVFKKFPLSLFQ